MRGFTTLIILFTFFLSLAQDKKIIDHSVYNDWKRLESQKISENGKFISYEIKPHRGDGYLYLYNTETQAVDSFFRCTNASFSKSNEFMVFKRTPDFDTLRTCELKKVDKKKWPKDELIIYRLVDKDQKVIPNIKSYSLSEEGNWMAYSIDSNIVEVDELNGDGKKKRFAFLAKIFKKKKADSEKPKKPTSDGKLTYLYNPSTEWKKEFRNVTESTLSKTAQFFLYTEHRKVEKEESTQLFAFNLIEKATFNIDSSATALTKMTLGENEKFLAYFQSEDTSKVKNYALKLYDLKDKMAYMTLDSNSFVIGAGNMPSINQSVIITDNQKYLFFGVSPAEKEEPEDTLLSSEKYTLDLWHYEDKRLQPQQLLELKRDQKASDLFVLNLDNFVVKRIENDSLKTRANSEMTGDYLLATNVLPYQGTYNWSVPNLEDQYRVSLIDGSVQLLREANGMGGELSPSGKYYTYFNEEQAQHYFIDIDNNTGSCITCGSTNVNWQSDNNGMPFTAYPRGIIGYDSEEAGIFVQSEFDVWRFDINTRNLSSITDGQGEKTNMRFSMRIWDRDSAYVTSTNTYLMGFDVKTKDEAVCAWAQTEKGYKLKTQYRTPHAINMLDRNKSGNRIILRKSNLQDYADLYLLDGDFKNEKRLSVSNPQQNEFNWATVELIDYKSRDNQKLQALLYKPEDFDSTKTYPLLVYFYELYSDDLHNHYAPRPTASIIYPTEYASAGYMVLIPDIRYKVGYPAKSAYNCIMGATDAALKKYKNIDSTRMGLQGQSWGGYQTAQLITMTTRYRAAMAGAPVSNMFSAYGGIRWGSGLNRQFQYEKTQSRIGKTIWEAPALYTENSPLFHLPKVQTPLLIMHNDADGSVPWYQGIELFTGMKRLGKPCWLLNYNGDDHNLMKNANRFDLSIRMRQFFDYYLLNEPAPIWLVDGIPATAKGKENRYELMKD